ncbi:MAG: hypothetical protein CL678_07445 [Bdellovibrionaceae bacterium]|nr:hypothetical protein [Pseudobdellovibrionaceae bacterium]|tara:strand:+ start:64 stop:759 length:696 start_codon:yes stop_codon:yes gene_type:complete
MKSRIEPIAEDIYRISVYPSESFSFNHFLIVDKSPVFIHMGRPEWFETLTKLVSEVIDPASIKYLTFSHFEADECSNLNRWLHIAKNAEVLVGKTGKASIEDFSSKPPRLFEDFETFDLGTKRLIALETPHCPHNWDACMFFEEITGTLFSSDLGANQCTSDLFFEGDSFIEQVILFEKNVGFMSKGKPLRQASKKISQMNPKILAIQHGAITRGVTIQRLLSRLIDEFCD